MTIRTSSKTVSFTHPFTLSGMGWEQQAGSYEVETDEELLEGLSFPAYRWLATSLRIPSSARAAMVVQIVGTTPAELDAALARDAETALDRMAVSP